MVPYTLSLSGLWLILTRHGPEFGKWQVTVTLLDLLPSDDYDSILKKCTPATPRCLRCAELKIDECLYVSVKKRGVGTTLRMGRACQRCR